jgi:hypothetical protein
LSSSGQNINYNPKQLSKDLKKNFQIEQFTLSEINLLDSNIFVQGKYFSMKSPERKNLIYIYIGRVNSCRVDGCSVSYEIDDKYETEYFDYFILFDTTSKVDYVRIFNYQATHGQEVVSKGWLKQFCGYDGSTKLDVGKEIDAIAGATISVFGITQDIEEKTKLLKAFLGNQSHTISN